MAKSKRPLPPNFQKQIDMVQSMGALRPFLDLLARAGIGDDNIKELKANLDALSDQANELVTVPVEFDEEFAQKGWLLSESSSLEAANEALALAKQGKVDEAEARLVASFEGDRLSHVAMILRQTPGFKIRMDLVQEAMRQSQARNYLAAVPLLLIIADGVGQDYFGKSIFSEGVDLEELTALAGHQEGLPCLIREMCRTRRKTSADEITFPYRNGIMHGRDLGYGNPIVTAKCWSLLTNIADVVRAREAVKALEAKPEEPEPGLIDSLKRYGETLKRGEEIRAWSPREIAIEPLPVEETETCPFDEKEPEAALFRFLKAWLRNNYGEMGRHTVYYDNCPINKRAGEIRDDLKNTKLVGATICQITDKAAAITEITAKLSILLGDKRHEEEFVFRLVCGDDTADVKIRGEAGARWQVMPSYQGWAIRLRFS